VNASTEQSTADQVGTSMSYAMTSEVLPTLNALIILSRSMHNCRVFGYYGGIQKLTALLKGKQSAGADYSLSCHLVNLG